MPYTGDVTVGGPADVRELPGLTITKVAVSEMANNAYLLRCTATGQALLIDAADLPVPVDRTVAHGDTVAVGEQVLEVVHLRGHTPGSIALVWRGGGDAGTHVFTGDSLFPGGPGRTTRSKDFTSLMDDLEQRVFAPFDDSTWFYPGHGKDTTLGAERPHLAEWRERGW